MTRRVVSFLVLLHLVWPLSAQTQGKRIALVIGNQAYTEPDLNNLKTATNDAVDMSKTLGDLGFSVKSYVNLKRNDFDRIESDFVATVRQGDTVVFYYAGHAVEDRGLNHLLPVDFVSADMAMIATRAPTANALLNDLRDKSPRAIIVILDACRTPPVGRRGVASGLAQINGARGEYVAFASSPGKPATDRSAGGRNGLFTSHLLASLKTPGLTIDEVFNNVRREVDRESGGEQTPWSNSGLVGDFCFDPRGCGVHGNSSTSVVRAAAPDCSRPASAPASEGEFVSQARCAFQSGEWAAAVQLYNGAIRINSENPEYYLQRALAQVQLRQLDRALADLAKAAEMDPDNADYSFETGKAEALFGNNIEAVAAFSKAHSLDPKRPDICAEFAAGLEKTGQNKTAAEIRRSCGL